MEIIDFNNISKFVDRSDALGGVGAADCDVYWSSVTFDFGVVDMPPDPFSEEYVSAQVKFYEAVAGRRLDQSVNENTPFDLPRHLRSPNPYAVLSPAELATHISRLSAAIKAASPPRGARMLDMGCGWGLSAEICAYLGMRVTAVDINPDFVSLVQQRAQSGNRNIEAVQASFDDFASDGVFDMILFYECFHHAVRPWTVLERMKRMMTTSSVFVLAGEPINDNWPHWGIRLDQLSIYCIRKFGWFESGWSRSFLEEMFGRAGFSVGFAPGGVGSKEQDILVARLRLNYRLDAKELVASSAVQGWITEPTMLVSQGESRLLLPESTADMSKQLELISNRPSPIALTIQTEIRKIEISLTVGRNEIRLFPGERDILMKGQIWCPAEELNSVDGRFISFHLEGVSMYE